MIWHFIKLSLRNIRRNLVFSVINLVGLSIGLATSFLILLYIADSSAYDKFHKNRDRIYRIISDSKTYSIRSATNSYMFADRLIEEIPEIEEVTTLSDNTYRIFIKKEDEFIYEHNIQYADQNLLKVLSFDMIYGDSETALKDLYSVVLTESTAIKYFNTNMVVGRNLTIRVGGDLYDLTVTGVIKDLPRLSSLKFPMLLSSKLGRIIESEDIERWKYTSDDCNIYLLLHRNQDIKEIEGKIKRVSDKYISHDPLDYDLQNIKNIYLKSDDIRRNQNQKGDLKNVRIFSIVGILILIISCLNYIITSIAQTVTRNKEIAIRKITGATRKNVIGQILGESILLTILAFPTALVLVEIFLPTVNKLFKVKLLLNYFDNPQYVFVMLAITLFVGLISGGYIALYLSGLKPVNILRQTFSIKGSKNYLGKLLIIFQTLIFTGLIFSSLVIFKQIQFAKNIDQGFNKNNLICIYASYINSNNEYILPLSTNSAYKTFIEELNQNSDIINASGCSVGPITGSWSKGTYYNPETPEKQITFVGLAVKYNFIETMEFDLIQGRSFSLDYASDSVNAVILNEEGVKALELTEPIGKIINRDTIQYLIIGVIRDFHMFSVQEEIPPIIAKITPTKHIMEVSVRYNPEKRKEVIDFLSTKYKKFAPDAQLQYVFYDDKISWMYGDEKSFGRNLIIFSVIAIIIAALGLFGFSLFISHQKTKEIGIRKALGSSVFRINKLFIKEFITLTLIANILAQPVVWILMNKWLQNYAYRTSIDYTVIISSFLISTIIVILTVNININIAARKKPVDTLRYE